MTGNDRESIPPIHFAPARGSRLAYQVFGGGPPTIVAIPPMAQNIEMAWEWPAIRSMFEGFGSFCRYLHFDKRGTGSSDRSSRVADIDERVDDLRAVMDHAGIGRAHLFGASEGGPMTLLFAATYPERVESVILSGSGASMYPPDPGDEFWEERRAKADRFVRLWGTPDSPVVDRFAPSLAGDQAFRDWHQRYERSAASADSLRDLLEITLGMDARGVLPALDVPVLVLHRTGDRVVPVERGREVAAAVPGAIVFEQDGDDHFNYAGDTSAWLDEIERFVTGTVRPRPPVPADDGSVRVVTLGRFAVEVDGREVSTSAWGTRLARQLCKRLVAARGWPVTRDELIDLLWPNETDMRKLGARLSVQLSAVRRVLRGGVIADRASVRLDLEEVATDLEVLYQATDDTAIVAAYTGEFLPTDRYDDWTIGARDGARARFVTAARRLAEQAVLSGDDLRAAQLAGRLIECDPYDERAHRLMVTSWCRAGEHGEARRAHESWVRSLGELGVEVARFEEIAGS